MSFKEQSGIDIDQLIFGISQISQMLNVSPRQLRYWEKRGYIRSLAQKDGQTRQYNAKAVVRIVGIKHFLDEGYTLAAAADKVTKFAQQQKMLHDFVGQRFQGVTEIDGQPALDFGHLADQHLYGVMQQGRAEFKLRQD